MPRSLLIGCAFLLLSVAGYTQEPSWSNCKSFAECQGYVRSWQAWADENLPKCKTAMADAKKLDAANTELRDENQRLRSDNESVEYVRIGFNLFNGSGWNRNRRRSRVLSSAGAAPVLAGVSEGQAISVHGARSVLDDRSGSCGGE